MVAGNFRRSRQNFTKMNPTISDSFASRRLKTSTQMVAGITVSIVDIVSDTYGGNEFLTFKTSEFGESEGLAVSCLTKGRQGNYVNDDGTIAESKTMQYPKGTAVDAYKQVLKAVNELRNEFSMQRYGMKFDRLDEAKQDIVKKAIPQNISEAEPKDVSKR